MAFKELTPELGLKRLRRVLIIGGPNTRKTSSIIQTFPKPIHIVSSPGEKGTGVIPTNDPDIKGYIWEEDDPAKVSISQQINELEKTTWEILAGAKGPITTFAFDGFHKLASMYWNREYNRLQQAFAADIAAGKTDRSGQPIAEAIRLQAYGNENYGANKDITSFLSKVLQSNVHTIVFTCWEGVETEDDMSAYAHTRHIFAVLPVQLARNLVTLFSLVLYAELFLTDPRGVSNATWQLQKQGRVWGVGVKVPVEVAMKLPTSVPQDWNKLYEKLAPLAKETQQGPVDATTK